MVFSHKKLHLSALKRSTVSRFLTQKSSILSPVLIAGRKSVKNGKNNLNRKKFYAIKFIYKSKKSCLSRPREKWSTFILKIQILLNGSPRRLLHRINSRHSPLPPRAVMEVEIIVTMPTLKRILIIRLRS
jgi:hypothetical protein